MVPDEILKQWRRNGLLESTALLGRQIESGLSFSLPPLSVKNLFWMGMGGSGLPAWITASFWHTSLKRPLFIHQRSTLPVFVKDSDLVVVSSYSGNTRETLEFYDRAEKNNLSIVGITGGGWLENKFKKNKTPYFKIDGRLNPANQPRMGVGFGLGFLARILFDLGWREEKDFLSSLNSFDFRQTVDFKSDLLENTTSSLGGKVCLVFAAPDLAGLGRFYQNQINETAKQPAKLLVFPELNHYFLEGLSQLGRLKKDFSVLILETGQEKQKDRKTIDLVAGWLEKRQISVSRLKLLGLTPVQQLFWGLSFGQQLALSLSYLNSADPLKISQVEWLKKEIGK